MRREKPIHETNQWKRMRAKAIAAVDGHCEHCNRANVQLFVSRLPEHFARKPRVSTVQVLCRECHNAYWNLHFNEDSPLDQEFRSIVRES